MYQIRHSRSGCDVKLRAVHSTGDQGSTSPRHVSAVPWGYPIPIGSAPNLFVCKSQQDCQTGNRDRACSALTEAAFSAWATWQNSILIKNTDTVIIAQKGVMQSTGLIPEIQQFLFLIFPFFIYCWTSSHHFDMFFAKTSTLTLQNQEKTIDSFFLFLLCNPPKSHILPIAAWSKTHLQHFSGSAWWKQLL